MVGFTGYQLEWFDKLESGEYPQSREVLVDSAGFCCLGVILVNEGHVNEDQINSFSRDGNDEDLSFCREVYLKYNLYNGVGTFAVPTKEDQELWRKTFPAEDVNIPKDLTSMNDDRLMTFKEIALFCRTFPHLVFTNFKRNEDGKQNKNI